MNAATPAISGFAYFDHSEINNIQDVDMESVEMNNLEFCTSPLPFINDNII